MKYAKNLLEVIGNTPLVKLNAIAEGIDALVLAKLEYLNPGGSMKDRIGIAMIEDAEKKGLLKPGGTIVEPTSGNTGVGLAIAAAIKGYKLVCTMSEKMSMEKEQVLRAYGAEVVRAPADVEPDDPRMYINLAKSIAEERGGYYPNQYFNRANTEAHYKTTGPEIWRDTEGKMTHYVAPVGTGGTISGAARFLKEKNPNIKVIGVDPEGSLIHHYFYKTEGKAKAYKVEGPGEDFMPGALDLASIDEIIVVNDKQSFDTARELVKKEGIFAGGSSGLAVFGALKIAKDLDKNAVVVVVLPDSGRSYVSKFYDDKWMRDNGFI
ncbi:cystathionine beta-synthase [Candidatus Peribacteria bacterium RIFCSPHIGHO2_01_FULL_49_38]|nr:MAG: cystathionine beta-synthase [Candidatus Peribacteria bacterium RIFCSPHIGHO2_01_FULL_49_38]